MMASGEVLSDQQQWDLLGLVRHVNSPAHIGPAQSKTGPLVVGPSGLCFHKLCRWF